MLKRKLQRVLNRAHRGHVYTSDQDQYQQPEFWESGLIGDCEDFALWIREQLTLKGIESDLVYCFTEGWEGHLVIHVDGWILDNRYKQVMRQDKLDYQWLKIGKPSGEWFTIATHKPLSDKKAT
jgi:predicted transglutaminase-like cysteine proteinase